MTITPEFKVSAIPHSFDYSAIVEFTFYCYFSSQMSTVVPTKLYTCYIFAFDLSCEQLALSPSCVPVTAGF